MILGPPRPTRTDTLYPYTTRCLSSLGQPIDSMRVEVTIGAPNPETGDKKQGLAVLPHGTGSVTVVEGGLSSPTGRDTDVTLVAHAAAIVYMDLPEGGAADVR